MSYTISLSGRSALVTGASGGLGRYFAGVLARAGAAVAVAARREDSLAHVRDEIAGAGGDAVAVAMDVTNAASVEKAIAEVRRRFGKLDILVNNAGVTVTKPFLDLARERMGRGRRHQPQGRLPDRARHSAAHARAGNRWGDR